MKLRFKHQRFQAEVATTVCNVFRDSGFINTPQKVNVFEIFKLPAPNTTVKVI
jgi:hypothetical protein